MSNEKKISKKEQNERLTNWYLINLTWGVVGILALLLISKGYNNSGTILAMQPMMWILTGVFAAGSIILFAVGKQKGSLRANHYAIFAIACTLVSLWLALYNKIRPLMENILCTLIGNSALNVSSYWNVRIPMIAIGIYLVISFIWFAIKVTRK